MTASVLVTTPNNLSRADKKVRANHERKTKEQSPHDI